MISLPSDCSHSLYWAQGSSWCENHRILVPDNWDSYERNDFSEPRLLHLPIHRKVLNSLTQDTCFPLINNNFFNVQTTRSLLKNFYITWLPLEQLSQDSLRWCLSLSPKIFSRIKHNSQLLIVTIFLSQLRDSSIYWHFDSSVGKESACNAGDPVWFLG